MHCAVHTIQIFSVDMHYVLIFIERMTILFLSEVLERRLTPSGLICGRINWTAWTLCSDQTTVRPKEFYIPLLTPTVSSVLQHSVNNFFFCVCVWHFQLLITYSHWDHFILAKNKALISNNPKNALKVFM